MNRITIDDSLTRRLDEAANRAGLPAETLVNEAVRAFLDLDDWRASETRKGLAEAEAGDFADESAVSAFRAKWRD